MCCVMVSDETSTVGSYASREGVYVDENSAVTYCASVLASWYQITTAITYQVHSSTVSRLILVLLLLLLFSLLARAYAASYQG